MKAMSRFIIRRDQEVLLSRFIIVLLIGLSGALAYPHLAPQPQITQILIYEPGVGFVSGPVSFQDATNLHLDQIRLAIDALFTREPGGLSKQWLLERNFSPDARRRVAELNHPEAENFQKFSLYQTPVIEHLNAIPEESRLTASLSGKLIRHGTFNGQSLPPIAPIPFECALEMKWEPSLSKRALNPTVVTAINYVLKKP